MLFHFVRLSFLSPSSSPLLAKADVRDQERCRRKRNERQFEAWEKCRTQCQAVVDMALDRHGLLLIILYHNKWPCVCVSENKTLPAVWLCAYWTRVGFFRCVCFVFCVLLLGVRLPLGVRPRPIKSRRMYMCIPASPASAQGYSV